MLPYLAPRTLRLSPWPARALSGLALTVLLTACGGGSSPSADDPATSAGGGDATRDVSGAGGEAGQPAAPDSSRVSAPSSGWASATGGTTGGSAALPAAVYTVSTATELLNAIKASGSTAKIIRVTRLIDMAASDNGGPFKDAADQSSRGKVALKSNTTLIGVGSTAGFVNASISIRGIDNVIVRNLTISNPCDIAPTWDSGDGSGTWKSAYDGISIDGARNIWIDHNTFTDAPRTDDLSAVENGELKRCHDGALDIKNGADYITVSYNIFELHNKNTLVGAADTVLSDDTHLTVTFHHNWFRNVVQRAPRVRFGRVHVYNNYYEGSKNFPTYAHAYSIGVGYKAKIISENNSFDVQGADTCDDVVVNSAPAGESGAIAESGSLLNGVALNMAPCRFSAQVGWSVPYAYSSSLQAASSVKQTVKSQAGVGKLVFNP